MTTTFKFINADQGFVWIWLPRRTTPVVAGRIDLVETGRNLFTFTYGKSYLENPEAIPLSPFELPLKAGVFFPEGMNTIHSCLRDSSPDAWGRRVIEFRYGIQLNELDYMLLSGNDRIGAIDFQRKSDQYEKVEQKIPKLEELLRITTIVEENLSLPKELEYALLCGTSIGGARPKALIQDGNHHYIIKFPLSTDSFNLIKAEYVGMRLAKLLGINVPNVSIRQVLEKEVLIVERFDREYKNSGFTRKLMLSALSLLKLNELEARYASYLDFADVLRQQSYNPKQDLIELYRRLVFNILIGNTDDHARNYSAFWDGKALNLTPAYDLCPQPRFGQEATQAMALEGIQNNFSTLVNALSIAEHFQLDKTGAHRLIHEMIDRLKINWEPVCDEAKLTGSERDRLWGKALFNPFIFQGFTADFGTR